MKYFSTFTGAGGFEIALNKLNWECVGFSEIDKFCNKLLSEKYPNIKNYGDIANIETKEIPDFDVLVGGSPCQDVSIAGKKEGLIGKRSGLFFEYIKILQDKKPKYFIWENVKGMLSSNKGIDFGTILNEFSECGYDLQWQVLNAKHFGVPQNRERIFIIGHIRGKCRPEIFPFIGENTKTISTGEVVGTLQSGYAKGDRTGGYVIKEKEIIQMNNPKHSNDRVYSAEGISPTLTTMKGGDRQPFILQKSQSYRVDGTLRHYQDNSPTLRANMGDNHPFICIPVITSLRIRKLTPLECERLMSWPDNWTQGFSNSRRYIMCGNGVVSNIVYEIAKYLK